VVDTIAGTFEPFAAAAGATETKGAEESSCPLGSTEAEAEEGSEEEEDAEASGAAGGEEESRPRAALTN
jgi:hypothetical protein